MNYIDLHCDTATLIFQEKDNYVKMKRVWELQEHREIYGVIKKREKTPLTEYVSFDDMAKRLSENFS